MIIRPTSTSNDIGSMRERERKKARKILLASTRGQNQPMRQIMITKMCEFMLFILNLKLQISHSSDHYLNARGDMILK